MPTSSCGTTRSSTSTTMQAEPLPSKPPASRSRAMSEHNVEVVRAGLEAWNTGDMDALHDLYDPNAIHKSLEGWPEPGPFVGREAVMAWLGQIRETWDSDA